jgi:hypothetical protein
MLGSSRGSMTSAHTFDRGRSLVKALRTAYPIPTSDISLAGPSSWAIPTTVRFGRPADSHMCESNENQGDQIRFES